MTEARYEATKVYLQKVKAWSLALVIFNPSIFVIVFIIGASQEKGRDFPVTFAVGKCLMYLLAIIIIAHIMMVSINSQKTIYPKKYLVLALLGIMLYFAWIHTIMYFMARNDLKKLSLEKVRHYEQINAERLKVEARTFDRDMQFKNEIN